MKQLTSKEYHFILKDIYHERFYERKFKRKTLIKDFLIRNKYSLHIWLKWKKGIIESWFSYRIFENKMFSIQYKKFFNEQKLLIPYERNFNFNFKC